LFHLNELSNASVEGGRLNSRNEIEIRSLAVTAFGREHP